MVLKLHTQSKKKVMLIQKIVTTFSFFDLIDPIIYSVYGKY